MLIPFGHGDELVDAGGELVYNGAKQLGDIEPMPADLMEELAQSGVKYTPEDVLMVTKNSDGDLLWLETGNEDAGLTHILEHKQQLSKCGIEEEEIPSVIKSWLGTEPKLTGRNDKGPFSVYEYNGKDILIAYGDNGYIVSVYPVKGKK